MLSCVESRAPARPLTAQHLWPNFVVRRDAIEAISGFPLELGRVGERLIGGEECYVIRRLLARNYDVLYDPAFAVQHCIHEDRMRRAWIERRAFWEGVTQVAVYDALDQRVPFHLSPLKLAASLPFLWALAHSGRADGNIRYRMALGGLYASFLRLRPGAFHAGTLSRALSAAECRLRVARSAVGTSAPSCERVWVEQRGPGCSCGLPAPRIGTRRCRRRSRPCSRRRIADSSSSSSMTAPATPPRTICKALARDDSRVRFVRKEVSAGAPAARNEAILRSEGASSTGSTTTTLWSTGSRRSSNTADVYAVRRATSCRTRSTSCWARVAARW